MHKHIYHLPAYVCGRTIKKSKIMTNIKCNKLVTSGRVRKEYGFAVRHEEKARGVGNILLMLNDGNIDFYSFSLETYIIIILLYEYNICEYKILKAHSISMAELELKPKPLDP